MIQMIYLNYAVEMNIARIHTLKLRHCEQTLQEHFLRLNFVNDVLVG